MFAHHQLRWCRVKVGVYTFSYFGVSSVDVPPSQCSCDSPLRQRRFTTIVIHAYIHVQTPHQSHPHVPHQLRRNVVILSYPLVMYRNGTIDGDHFLSLSFFLCVCTCVVPYFDCLFDLIVALLISFSLVVVAQVCISFSLASSHLSPPLAFPLLLLWFFVTSIAHVTTSVGEVYRVKRDDERRKGGAIFLTCSLSE